MRLTPDMCRVYVGYSADEAMASRVAEASLRAHATMEHGFAWQNILFRRLSRFSIHNVYTRETERREDGRIYDVISNAPMSTDHAIARFFVPFLCDYAGWALFTDGDVLCRRSIHDLFAGADEHHAVQCVQHPPLLGEGLKKDDALQLSYPRKNWSSVMLFNCGHPANRVLDLATLNQWPGRDLHAFKWLKDTEIGALDPTWNYLVNIDPPQADPAMVHYTEGIPSLPGHETDPFAREWFGYAQQAGYDIPLDALKAVS